jgi:ATP-dependent DNA helicase RecG
LLQPKDIPENIPPEVLEKLKLMNRFEAYRNIHFPTSAELSEQSIRRIKFEELFIAQVRLQLVRLQRHKVSRGVCLKKWAICLIHSIQNTFLLN